MTTVVEFWRRMTFTITRSLAFKSGMYHNFFIVNFSHFYHTLYTVHVYTYQYTCTCTVEALCTVSRCYYSVLLVQNWQQPSHQEKQDIQW